MGDQVLLKTTWCCYAYYAGIGCDGLDLPCWFVVGEVCCVGGTAMVVPCFDEDGYFALTSKCFCCIAGIEVPPDNTPGIGCCCARTRSNIEGRTLDDCKSMAAKNELDTYKKTMWCL